MASRQSPDFAELLTRLSSALGERKIPFMLIGGQAVLLHGEPRLTQDVDVTLGVSPDHLPEVLAASTGADLAPLPEDLESFVRETFVLPLEDPRSGVRVDLIFSTTPYEAGAIERAVWVELGEASVPFASPEDLILHKLFAGRPRDLEDVRSVVRRKGEKLDWGYLLHWAHEFAAIPGRERLPEEVERLREEGRDDNP
jgi:hypothetical protein